METKNEINNEQATQTARTGFSSRVMPVLSKDGEYVYFFLGDMTVTEHANRFKGLMGLEYQPKTKSEGAKPAPRTGLNAKIGVSISKDKEWITLYLPGNLGRITNHVNAYKYIFGLEFTPKSKKAA